jgi:hypothetical protein
MARFDQTYCGPNRWCRRCRGPRPRSAPERAARASRSCRPRRQVRSCRSACHVRCARRPTPRPVSCAARGRARQGKSGQVAVRHAKSGRVISSQVKRCDLRGAERGRGGGGREQLDRKGGGVRPLARVVLPQRLREGEEGVDVPAAHTQCSLRQREECTDHRMHV